MPLTIESARVLFTPELAEDALKEVVRQLQDLARGWGFLAFDHEEARLQGDVWDGLPVVRLATSGVVEVRRARVLLLSNSCDIAADNKRDIPATVTYVPVVRFSAFRAMLERGGADADSIEAFLGSTRRNENSRFFFIAAGASIDEDVVALLDQAFSAEAEVLSGQECERIAVLTDRGHWALILKLSVHFCRLREGVDREAA